MAGQAEQSIQLMGGTLPQTTGKIQKTTKVDPFVKTVFWQH
jgi:hypothetical protein